MCTHTWDELELAFGRYHHLVDQRAPEWIGGDEGGQPVDLIGAEVQLEAVGSVDRIDPVDRPRLVQLAGHHQHACGVVAARGHRPPFLVDVEAAPILIEDPDDGHALLHPGVQLAIHGVVHLGLRYTGNALQALLDPGDVHIRGRRTHHSDTLVQDLPADRCLVDEVYTFGTLHDHMQVVDGRTVGGAFHEAKRHDHTDHGQGDPHWAQDAFQLVHGL